MHTFQARLFDLYPFGDRMVLWFLLDSGRRLRLERPYRPAIRADDAILPREREALFRSVRAGSAWEFAGRGERLDFWTGRPRAVLEFRCTDMDRQRAELERLHRAHPSLVWYDCDIPPEVQFGYETGLFPTALCRVRTDGSLLDSFEIDDDPFDPDYEPLPLRVCELSGEGLVPGGRSPIRALTAEFEGRAVRWDEGSPDEVLASLNAFLRETDPDLILTDGGDADLMPALFSLAARFRVPLALDREPGVARRIVSEGRSYMSYGRVLYRTPDYPLFGRWHLDRLNSFWSAETGLAGVVEVARVSKIPVQRAARRSVGTGISSIQLDLAFRRGVLVPWKKSRPESWKSVARLIAADRGGLVYQPLTGAYENAVELDFVSMYPTIMVDRNVSPETVDCDCCPPEPAVPEIGYSICRKRRGLVSEAIAPVIAKRKRCKSLAKAAVDPEIRLRHEGRQSALKWLLVCCFGYLGYRNARFGRIEAHESTCAFSREILLRAKEICEDRDFEVLHAVVDCVWLRKPGAGDEEIRETCAEIERETGLAIALEGVYDWIVFLPSAADPELPVPNRYFGRFRDGKMKLRGIEIRRRDQAPFVAEFQGRLLELLAGADSLAACRALKDRLLAEFDEACRRLREREVPVEKLVLRRTTSRAADEYRGSNATAVAARQAARAGIPLHAGESIAFVVVDEKNRDPDSRVRIVPLLRPEETGDPDYYVERTRRAAATLLEPLLGRGCLPAAAASAPAKRRAASAPPSAHPFF